MEHNNKMDYKINFSEPIPQMVDRLKREHVDFGLNLDIITNSVDANEINKATKTIRDMSELIIKHAVEEEARIMRVIMQKAKEESKDSIKIMQEHNWVVDFLKQKLPDMENEIIQQGKQHDQQQQQKLKDKINEYVSNLRNHFSEEEQIVFPLALKADSK
jgi:hemerythrin-like domain-containing protein